MKRREVNLGRTDENIADQYPNIYEGLQKDAGQNSWDAKATKKGKQWKLVFRYIPKLNSLSIEDFGTVGMNAKRWKEYQSLWDTTKAEEATLGARGQGKFLFHYFATNKLVLTESIDEEGNYHFSFGNSQEYDDENGKLEDFVFNVPRLDHQGTKIWIMDIKKELLDELLDCKAFMSYIAATWWEIIRNWGATFIVNFDGIDHLVELPKLPRIKKEKIVSNEKIQNLGRIRNLKLYYCEDEVPELWKGIAVQRGGMTILRLSVAADEAIKNRIWGYCDFDENLESELKKLEFPNHFGFNNKRAWNHTKEYIREKSDEFVQEASPVRKKEITLSQDLVAEAIHIVNDLVREYIPEVTAGVTSPGGKGQKEVENPYGKREIPPIRIDTFRGNARKLEYDESLITECELVNETADEAKLLLQIEIKHEEGNLKLSVRYSITLDSNKRERINIPLVDFEENTDRPGQYKATAMLEGEKEPHRRSFTFYLHEEPPLPKGKVFLGTIESIFGRGTSLEKKKQLPVTEKGVLRIIWDHRDFIHVRELARSRRRVLSREMLLYMVKCGIDGAVQKLFELKYNEGELSVEQMRGIKDKSDAMYYDAVLRSVA